MPSQPFRDSLNPSRDSQSPIFENQSVSGVSADMVSIGLSQLPQSLVDSLSSEGQKNLLSHLNDPRLSSKAQTGLLDRLQQIHWQEMHQTYVAPALDAVHPPQVTPYAERPALKESVETVGRKAYADGEVSVLLVAGGDGTRLGFDRPKGCFPIGPVSADSLYQKIAEKVLAQSRHSGIEVPFVVMTGPGTDLPTRAFFEDNQFFGLNPAQVRFFRQATIPTTTVPDSDGKFELLFKGPGELLESPNGHGGTIDGLIESGSLDWLLDRGIKDIVYLQVDNALAPVFDPFAVGLRRARSADMVTKVIPKVTPEEKMGALVKIGDHDAIVEYSDLNSTQQNIKNPDGSLLFGWGNVAAHVFGTDFISHLRNDHLSLPYHQAHKKVQAWNGEIGGDGSPVMVEMPGRKSERFIFDVLTIGKNVGLEMLRSEEFAPLKNKDGADSIATARALISAEFKRQLALCGIEIDEAVTVEISPLFADTLETLLERRDSIPEIRPGRDVLL